MNSAAMRNTSSASSGTLRRRPANPAISMDKVIASAYRQRYILLGIVGLALLIGAVVTFMTPRRYSATASVQLNQQAPRILPNRDLDPEPSVQDSERFLQTQLDRIMSRSMAEAVDSRLRASSTPRILAALGFDEGGANARREDVITALQENVIAVLGLNTRLARITFTSRDPAVAATVANAYAEALGSSNLIAKGATATQAEQYLMGEMAEAKAKLQASERAMLAYARSADLTTTVVPGQDRGGSLRAQQLGMLTDQLANATARRIEAQQQWQQVQNTPPLALREVQENRAIQDLIAQKAQLEATVAAEEDRYTTSFPGVTSTIAKADQIDAQIAALAANIRRSYQGQYSAALQAERQLSGTVNQLRGAAMAERERTVDYNALQREVDTNRAFYDGLLQRYQEIAAASGAPGASIVVVDRAEAPTDPSSPSVPKNMGLSGVLGLIAAMGVGLLRERTVSVVRSADDAERMLDIPNLGMVPAVSAKERADVELLNPRSPQSEAYYSAAVGLHQMAGSKLPKVTLVTSSMPGEGKSTSSIGLARSFAAMRERVLLIDGDLRRPSLGAMLGARLGAGMSNVLAGTATIEAATQQLDGLRFDLITAGDAQDDPISLLSSETLAETLRQMAERYDIILIDGPPIMGIADPILLAAHAQAAVFVIESGRIESQQLQLAMARLPAGLPAGSIITKFNAKVAGVKYGSKGYYQY